MNKCKKAFMYLFIIMLIVLVLTINCAANIGDGTNTTIDKSKYAIDQVSGKRYSYGGYEINMFTYWNGLSATKKTGISITSIYGFPAQTPSEINAGTADNAYAATQVILWEFQLGYRNLSGRTNDTLYNGYIKGTGAIIPYLNIEQHISLHTKVPPYG